MHGTLGPRPPRNHLCLFPAKTCWRECSPRALGENLWHVQGGGGHLLEPWHQAPHPLPPPGAARGRCFSGLPSAVGTQGPPGTAHHKCLHHRHVSGAFHIFSSLCTNRLPPTRSSRQTEAPGRCAVFTALVPSGHLSTCPQRPSPSLASGPQGPSQTRTEGKCCPLTLGGV